MVNWNEEVLARKNQLLEDLFGLLRIESVKDLSTSTKEQPMGKKVGEALDYVLHLSEELGLDTKNVDGYAGHGQLGQNEVTETIGILCHVDVVPASGEWTSPPFQPEIRDGKIFARGAIDDKGPTMAAFYGLKIIKELGLPLRKNVRIIFGTDEESGMSCMRHYKKVGEMPKVGFAPDADFPIIHAEKGQINTKVGLPSNGAQHEESDLELVSFVSGDRINMVPEQATAVIKGDLDRIQEEFEDFCQKQGVQQSSNQKGDGLELIVFGKAAHGMEPHVGINAGTTLATFLKTYKFESNTQRFMEFLSDLHKDFEGKDLGIAYQDEITGPLTVNPGVIHVDREESYVRLNIRCPVTTDYDEVKGKLEKSIDEKGLIIEELRQSRPHHVEGDDPFIQALQKAYEDETGMEPTLLSTGGGTYARFMEKGVAYGASFPGKEMTAHQKDEYIEVDDLTKATAIYARAIYEMAK